MARLMDPDPVYIILRQLKGFKIKNAPNWLQKDFTVDTKKMAGNSSAGPPSIEARHQGQSEFWLQSSWLWWLLIDPSHTLDPIEGMVSFCQIKAKRRWKLGVRLGPDFSYIVCPPLYSSSQSRRQTMMTFPSLLSNWLSVKWEDPM